MIIRPVWSPATFDEAASDVRSRELFEHAYLDFKRDMYPTTKAGRTEAAKDMAAMGPYGGRLILGIAEDKQAGVASGVYAIVLSGVREWLDQVALERVDPALNIQTTPLHDPSDPSRATGVVVVDIAPSPHRVHQVDGVYYGRSDRGRYRLPDAEVERLLAERVAGTAGLRAPLADAVANYGPWLQPQGVPASGWIVVVVEPVPHRDEALLYEAIGDNDGYPKWIREHARRADDGFALLSSAHPELARVVGRSRTGWDSATASRLMGGVEASFEHDHREGHPYRAALQIHESGRVVVVENHLAYNYLDGKPYEWSWRAALGHVVWALTLVKNLTAEVGYRSGADVAVHLGGIKGLLPETTHLMGEAHQRLTLLDWTGPTPCPVAELDSYGRAGIRDLQNGDLRRVLDDLFGKLLRSLGLQNLLR